jgi:hypothetical protein
VDALSGVGLAGDRYVEPKNRRSPDYEVTLIELGNIEGFARATGKGGLRARIVSGGILSVGDQVSWLRDER